jgi:cbb3-type cytochrome oxidase maturation protein
MDVLYVLVPLSVVLVLVIVGILAWSVWNGQFEGVEQEGERILQDDDEPRDRHDGAP